MVKTQSKFNPWRLLRLASKLVVGDYLHPSLMFVSKVRPYSNFKENYLLRLTSVKLMSKAWVCIKQCHYLLFYYLFYVIINCNSLIKHLLSRFQSQTLLFLYSSYGKLTPSHIFRKKGLAYRDLLFNYLLYIIIITNLYLKHLQNSFQSRLLIHYNIYF